MADITQIVQTILVNNLVSSANNVKSSIVAGCTDKRVSPNAVVGTPIIGKNIGTIDIDVSGKQSPSTFYPRAYEGADLYWLFNYGFQAKKEPSWYGYRGWIPYRPALNYFLPSVNRANLLPGVYISNIDEPTTYWH